jgi:hypothetical protein
MGSVKQLFFLTLVFLSLRSQAFAANVSFLVVETGIREGSPVNEASNIWESALMDEFFEGGHIVSNAPIMRLPRFPDNEIPDEARGSLEDALQGGAGFFILALLDYQGPPRDNSSLEKPRTVSLRLFRTRPFAFLFGQDYSPHISAPGTPAGTDEAAAMKRTIRMIMPYIREAVQKPAGF